MTDVLSKIPLVGWGPIITIAAIAVSCLIIAILLWRNHKVWRWVFVFLFLVVRRRRGRRLRQHAVSPTSTTSPTCWASRRTRRSTATPVRPRRPAAAQRRRHRTITVPDTASHFGSYEAQVWLPPQYFSDSAPALPGRLSAAREPRRNHRLADLRPAARPPVSRVAQAGKPVILVMPEDLQNSFTGRQPLRRHPVAGQRRDLPHQGRHRGDRQPVPHHHQRQGAGHRRHVDGRVLRPQPRAQAPRHLLGGPRLLRRDGVAAGHPAGWQPGALRRLGLAAEGRREQSREVLHARSTAARARRSGWTWAPGPAILRRDAGRSPPSSRPRASPWSSTPARATTTARLDGGAQGRAALGGAADDGAHPLTPGNPHHPARR